MMIDFSYPRQLGAVTTALCVLHGETLCYICLFKLFECMCVCVCVCVCVYMMCVCVCVCVHDVCMGSVLEWVCLEVSEHLCVHLYVCTL